MRVLLILFFAHISMRAQAGFLCKGSRLHSSDVAGYIDYSSSEKCEAILKKSLNGFFCDDEGYLYNRNLEIIEYGAGNYNGFKNNQECLSVIEKSK